MPITSGSIEYERRLNLGEYNHKNVVAKVGWTVEPGETDEELAAFAVDMVVTRVKDVLNWKPADPAQVPAEVVLPGVPDLEPNLENIENMAAPNLAAQHPAAEITAGIPPAVRRHRRTKAEMEAARAAEANPTQTSPDGSPSSVTAEPDPTLRASSEPISGGEPGMPSFDPDPAPPAEVTDLDLQNACQARVSGGLPHAPIKELVAKFSPGALFQTPQDARRRFLEELAKL